MTTNATPDETRSIGILWRGDPSVEPKPTAASSRLSGVFAALARHNVAAEPVIYADDVVEPVRSQLLRLAGVLVWVDPIAVGQNRTMLDALLRDVAEQGVWVSAHPQIILTMGTKELLFRTRHLGWGVDTYRYRTADELRAELPRRLASGGARVLKPNRGNGGIGVWRVELDGPSAPRHGEAPAAAPGMDAAVRVLHAQRGSREERMTLGEFLDQRADYFDGTFAGPEMAIDQPFQHRLGEGMIRCYLVQNEVIGFGQQLIKALLPAPPPDAGPDAALPGPRIMHPASAPPFQGLRRAMEAEWVPAMQQTLGIDTASLPAIWDADFLYGPKTAAGEDSYVLCEINVSAVSPFPEEALEPLTRAVVARMRSAETPRA